jgi:hypothetical protein
LYHLDWHLKKGIFLSEPWFYSANLYVKRDLKIYTNENLLLIFLLICGSLISKFPIYFQSFLTIWHKNLPLFNAGKFAFINQFFRSISSLYSKLSFTQFILNQQVYNNGSVYINSIIVFTNLQLNAFDFLYSHPFFLLLVKNLGKGKEKIWPTKAYFIFLKRKVSLLLISKEMLISMKISNNSFNWKNYILCINNHVIHRNSFINEETYFIQIRSRLIGAAQKSLSKFPTRFC